ncbi:DNA polymerase II [Colwellia echini]|uniref:DNA polymerase n=1 Tax=Colwellia echini TaxID=1982103 RepID=A0ABY3MTY7_9GAMM|nr:DNA polymerase II [Colwellia echini]TYK64572.1 DNA polymerase II [Colwellia echini]
MTTDIKNNINSGFLLTRQVQDKHDAILITLWLKSEVGPVKLEIHNELAIFFIELTHREKAKQLLIDQKTSLAKEQIVSLKTFKQNPVAAFYFSNLRSFYRAREILKLNNIKCYEDDIRPDDRFLMERHITANIDYISQQHKIKVLVDNQYQLAQQVKCKRAAQGAVNQHLSMLSIDIECSMQGELYSIGLYAANSVNNNSEVTNEKLGSEEQNAFKRVLMIGEPQNGADEYIHWQADEKQLLKAFIKEVTLFDADIFIGWNVINFDFMLLQKRCDLHNIPFAIGRDGSAPYWRKNANNEDQHFIELAGRVVLDGIDLLKTATYSFPSFSLDNVAQTLLGLNKKVTDVENRVEEITNNFNHNKAALAAYNLEDCRLVWLIFEKTQLLAFAQLRAQLTGLAIDRVGGSVAAFTNLYLPKLHRSGYVAPNMGDGVSGLISPGGYVMDSKPGLYSNVLVLDFKSLYPSIIRTFKIDPMGLIEGLKQAQANNLNGIEHIDNVISGFDGAYFSRTKHFLPDIIESLWLERDKAKLQKNAALSQAIKIIMNSFYGVLGSTGCRFFDPRLSSSITKRSHEILKSTSVWIEALGYQVIYGDTDSIFVSIGAEKSKDEAQSLGTQLQKYINEKWQQKLKDDFTIESQLDIEFETHFTRFFMPSIRGSNVIKDQKSIGTKKRYAGVVNKKLIFKGLETVRSDWTELSKTFQQELYRLIFNDEPIDDYITQIVTELRSGQHNDQLIYSKKIRRPLNDYVNTPPHIKAALIANEKIIKLSTNSNNTTHQSLYKHRSLIRYVMTLDGVQPFEFNTSKLDYDFYVEKQLKPIADDILPFIGKDFESISGNQMGLF